MLKTPSHADVRLEAFRAEAARNAVTDPHSPGNWPAIVLLGFDDGAPHEGEHESNGEQAPPIQYPGPPSFAKAGFSLSSAIYQALTSPI